MKKERFLFLLLFFTFLLSPHRVCAGEAPLIEIVESVPVETTLDVPEIRNTPEVWLEMIGSAKKSLDIEVFYITDKRGESIEKILDAVMDAAKRGVKVRIICEESFRKETDSAFRLFRGIPNITCRYINSFEQHKGIMHAKYFIVDGKEVFLGSINFDWRSLIHINEVGVRIHDRDFARAAGDLFEMDWKLSRGEKGISPVAKKYPVPFRVKDPRAGVVEFYPVFTPKGMIADDSLWEAKELLKLIAKAKHEILLQVLTYSPISREGDYWPDLDCALRAAASRGVKVKITLSDWSMRKPAVDHIKSLALIPNIEIKFSTVPPWSGGFIPYARVQHGKFLVIDDTWCWVGGNNWEKNYFYSTRGIGIVIHNKYLNSDLRKIFFTTWNSSCDQPVDATKEYVPPRIGE